MKFTFVSAIVLAAVFFFCSAVPVMGENSDPARSEQTAEEAFFQTIALAENQYQSQKEALSALKEAIREENRQRLIYTTQLNGLRNFLLVSETPVSTIEKGIADADISLSLIKSKMDQRKAQEEKTNQTLSGIDEKLSFIRQRIQDWRTAKNQHNAAEPGLNDLKSYQSILEKQQSVLNGLRDLARDEYSAYARLITAFTDIRQTLQKEVKSRKDARLFQRNELNMATIRSWQLSRQPAMLITAFGRLFSLEQIKTKAALLKEYLNLESVFIVLVTGVIFGFCYRGILWISRHPWFISATREKSGAALLLLRHTIFWSLLLPAAVILSKTRFNAVFPDFIRFIISFLTVILFTRIIGHSIRLLEEKIKWSPIAALARHRQIILNAVIVYSFCYLFIYRFISLNHALLVPLRIVFEIILTAAVFIFWNRFMTLKDHKQQIRLRVPEFVIKSIVLFGLLSELSGYGHFASWWFTSWGTSIVIICIWSIVTCSLMDFINRFRGKFNAAAGTVRGISYPAYWIAYNSIYLAVFVLAVGGLALAWGAGDAFFFRLIALFTHKFTVGKLELSLAGFTFAILLLVVTYLITLAWKKIMAAYILNKSGLSAGAKDSVITLTVYLIWAAGILISLGAFGLDTTSLTVALGALGIGLGFGLQNIFNNFISGLILLFERPIQVNDVVEVGGTWGEVKKINVRSTLVQTYDNSSLIIPNSEFISARVTNWSHKDPYIRRDLLVGVAYGSDTGLVKSVLLKAADSVKEVSRYPQTPQVHFLNFGDSSLDFRLRFWTTIDDFIPAESNLRFEIDRLFRENHIVIPFPQRDIHIIQPG